MLNASLKNQLIKTFAQTLVDLTDPKEVEEFLRDFFRGSELMTYVKRLSVAYWLKKGRSRLNIKKNLEVTPGTISEVEKLMKKPGFALALKKIEAEEWANVWAEKIRKITKI